MTQYQSKLIVLRGNSGSGKTSTAKKLREKAKNSSKIAVIEQDYLRRHILREKEADNGDYIELIKQTVEFALSRNYDVILEGILNSRRHGKMLAELIEQTQNHFIYYLDVSFEETLKRHSNKPNAHEFGEKEMREWYKERDVLGFEGEKIIPEDNNMSETIKEMLTDTEL